MKKLVAIILLMICAVISRAQTTSLSVPMDGTACSNSFFQALLEKDVNRLEAILSDDFTIISYGGQMVGREELRQAIAQGSIVVDWGMLSGTNTKSYSNVAVVTGLWNVKVKVQQAEFQGDVAYMTVCVKAGGSWKVSAVQLTPVR